jgi:hypothetical protein
MDQMPGQVDSWEAIVEAVQHNLRREFQASVPLDMIDSTARASVQGFVAEGARIKSFVPIFAGKRAREQLRSMREQLVRSRPAR